VLDRAVLGEQDLDALAVAATATDRAVGRQEVARGDDDLGGGRGDDVLVGGAGRDLLAAGAGRDLIRARDGRRDRIRCGAGFDRVRADRRDRVAGDCERVSR
jgi:Ca2+-binding RTX toxin-like protein